MVPFSGLGKSDRLTLIIVCIGRRITAECIKQNVMKNTSCDCVLAIDYGFENSAQKLLMLEFNLNMGCSLNCIYCPQEKILKTYGERYDGKKRHMTFEEFKKIVDRHLNPCAIVAFSGMSEPFENSDFVHMAEYASESGYRIFLNTSLMGMNNEKFERLKGVEIESIILHIPDRENHSKFKITNEYLDLLDKFILFFQKKIKWYSCHADREADDISSIIYKYDIPFATAKNFSDRGGNLEISKKGIWHTNEIICTCGETSTFCHVVMPNGELALCCNDYGLEGNLGNLLSDYSWDDICLKYNGYKNFIEACKNNSQDYVCRRCNNACEKKWGIEHLYPFYYYESNNYIKTLIQKSEYDKGNLNVQSASFFKDLISAGHICLFGLRDDKESNLFFEIGWNQIIRADFFSDITCNLALEKIGILQYISMEDLEKEDPSQWLFVLFSDKENKVEDVLSGKGFNKYFYFCDFINT